MLQSGTVLQYSYFSVILGSLLKQCILFAIFLQFCLPPPDTKLKLGKNSGYTHPTLFVGWGEGWMSMNWKTPQKRNSVSRLLSMIVWKRGGKKKTILSGFKPGEVFFGLLMKDRNWTNCFLAFQSFLDMFEEFARSEWCTPEIVIS